MENNTSQLDAARRFLLKRTDEVGATLKGLSIYLGRNPGYLHSYVHRGSPRKLDGDDRRRLAEALGASEADLLEPDASPSVPKKTSLWAKFRHGTAPTGVGILRAMQEMEDLLSQNQSAHLDPEIFRSLPMKGWFNKETQVAVPANEHGVGFTDRPPWLVGADDAYAINMWNSFMEPALRKQHALWVAPGFEFIPGHDVVITLPERLVKPDTDSNRPMVMIKNLLEITPNKITVMHYNPKVISTFPRVDGMKIELVMGAWRSNPVDFV